MCVYSLVPLGRLLFRLGVQHITHRALCVATHSLSWLRSRTHREREFYDYHDSIHVHVGRPGSTPRKPTAHTNHKSQITNRMQSCRRHAHNNRKAPRAGAHAVAVERGMALSTVRRGVEGNWRAGPGRTRPRCTPNMTDAELRASAKQLGATVEQVANAAVVEAKVEIK